MAGIKRPSFTKKLKEQKRLARAAEKRDARHARRQAQKAEAAPLVESPSPPEEETAADVPSDEATP